MNVPDQVGEPPGLVRDQCEEGLPLIGRQLAPATLQRPRRADHGGHRAPKLMGHERNEVGAKCRQAPKLLDRLPLRLVRADVLDRGRDHASEELGELYLLLAERARTVADERQHPDRPGAELERHEQAATQAERGEVVLLRILRRVDVLPVDESPLEHLRERRSVDRPR